MEESKLKLELNILLDQKIDEAYSSRNFKNISMVLDVKEKINKIFE